MSPKENKNSASENLHAGHRIRMKQQLLGGAINENSPPHLLLETLLFFSVPRCDTNPIAHRLINRFGSVGAVLSAPEDELLSIEGVSENTVSLFRIFTTLQCKIANEKADSKDELRSAEEIGEYLLSRYILRKSETVSVLCLRGNGKVLSFDFIGEGDISSVGLSTRRIVELAIKNEASLVVLAHNHPSGIALPSAVDVEITRGLASALKQVDIQLLDHIILTDSDFVSMAQSQEYSNIF